MHSVNHIIFLLFLFYLYNIIDARVIKNDKSIKPNLNNKYYIISIKDSSKYSFDIQPSKQDENEKLRKKDLTDAQKFDPVDFKEIEEEINGNDCNLDDSLCDLKDKNVDYHELVKELKPEKKFVNEQLEKIAEIIIDNLDTYMKDDVVNENLDHMIVKRSTTTLKELLENEIFKKMIRKAYDILDVTVIYAYLSDEVYEIIKDLPDVVECVENYRIEVPKIPKTMGHIINPLKNKNKENFKKIEKQKRSDKKNKKLTSFYNITDIKLDTKWSGVSVQDNAGSHLSLISQSKFNPKLIDQYDSNYYYPSSAGEGVDIYIVDSGINVNHIDFDTTYRTVTCDAITNSIDYEVIDKNSELAKNCTNDASALFHGIGVASAAAGSINGVAKKANIHMVAIDTSVFDIISGLEYINKYAKNPHKTVINISSGFYYYVNTLDKLIHTMVRKGFMIIASAGNENIDACVTKSRYINDYGDINEMNYPSSFVDVIAVGSTSNTFEELNTIPKGVNIYDIAFYSNYGSCIDIYAPGYAYLASFPDNPKAEKLYTTTRYMYGTSFSSPLVAGVAALLISEHPEITFDQEILRKMLIDLSIKDIIKDLDSLNTPNRFLNIGKSVVYSSNNNYKGCGILSGKKSCSNDYCCSKEGFCGKEPKFCEVDCQSEFGHCSSNNHPSKKKEKDNNEPSFKNAFIYNYFMDLCLKFVPGNDVEENIILTICDNEDSDYYWHINNKKDDKVAQDAYEDVCMHFNKEGIVYGDPCKTGSIIKNINEVYNKDAIRSEEFSDKCLKPFFTENDLYGVAIITDSRGFRVKMDTCNYDDEYQHWRMKEIPEIIQNSDYDDILTDDPEDNDDNNEEEEKEKFETKTIENTTDHIRNEESEESEEPEEFEKLKELEDSEEDSEKDDVIETTEYLTTVTLNVDDVPTGAFTYSYPEPTETYSFREPEPTHSSDEIIYNEYGQVFNKEDYIPFIFNRVIVTNTKKVWIYNPEKNLCLSSPGRYNQQALLEKCDSKKLAQQWLIPDNNHGYYINVEDNDISIIYTPDKRLIYNGYIEVITLGDDNYIKNHSSVISYEDDTLKINDIYHNNEEVCLSIQKNQRKKKNNVLLEMIPCDQPHSKFILSTEFPNNKKSNKNINK